MKPIVFINLFFLDISTLFTGGEFCNVKFMKFVELGRGLWIGVDSPEDEGVFKRDVCSLS